MIQEAWAWLTATQLTRASAAAALRSEAAQARALRREDAAPVTADEESFTVRRPGLPAGAAADGASPPVAAGDPASRCAAA
ncbi:MAG TPA: hypothetical protein VG123_33230 [Streptosporangiaceae bacterium]|nr:hypothetical protein [Streptosporangiaceae bacterium]